MWQRFSTPSPAPVPLRCNLDWGASLLRLVEGRFKLFPQAQRMLMTHAAPSVPAQGLQLLCHHLGWECGVGLVGSSERSVDDP